MINYRKLDQRSKQILTIYLDSSGYFPESKHMLYQTNYINSDSDRHYLV